MPQVGEKRSDGKVWAGSDYGWQSTGAVWKGQKPGSKAGETRSIPGAGKKVWTGKDYGWQTQATIDKTKKGADRPQKPSAPASTPSSASPAPAATSTPAKPSETPSSASRPAAAKPAAKPAASSASASTAEKIKGGLETYKKQIKSGDVKGAEATGKSTWALANPKLAAAAAERARTRGTSSTTNPQMADLKSKLPSAKPAETAKPAPTPTPSTPVSVNKSPEMNKAADSLSKSPLKVKKEAYEIVLEYLFSNGHVDTISEALYVITEMDAEYIRNIIENIQSGPILPGEKGKKIYPKGQEPKPTGAKLPTLPPA